MENSFILFYLSSPTVNVIENMIAVVTSKLFVLRKFSLKFSFQTERGSVASLVRGSIYIQGLWVVRKYPNRIHVYACDRSALIKVVANSVRLLPYVRVC